MEMEIEEARHFCDLRTLDLRELQEPVGTPDIKRLRVFIDKYKLEINEPTSKE